MRGRTRIPRTAAAASTNLPLVTVSHAPVQPPRSRGSGARGPRLRLLCALCAALTMGAALLMGAPTRAAAEPGPAEGRFTSVDERIELDRNGVARVRIDLVLDAGTTPVTGPVLRVPRRIEADEADGHRRYRAVRTTDVGVTSPTGASTAVRSHSARDERLYTIGDRGAKVVGVQRYTITMTVRGLVTPGSEQDGFVWPAVLAGSAVHNRFTAVVVAPDAVLGADCASGGADCRAFTSGVVARFAAQDVGADRALVLRAHCPRGTFQDVDESYTTVKTLADRFPLDGPDLVGAAVILVVGGGLTLAHLSLICRDHRWASPVPGTIPPPPGTRVVRGTAHHVPQRSCPPEGTRPAEVGMLIDARPEFAHITATMLDLAVRGFMTIHREEDHAWTFRRTDKEAGALELYERTVLKKMFPKVKGRIVTVTSTQQISRAKGGFLTTREGIERRVAELGWFRVAPNKARARCRAVGTVVGLGGLLSVVLLAGPLGLGLWSVAITSIGLLVLAVIPLMPSRTPVGSAVREQAMGFRSFLVDLDPESVDWAESGNIFGRYLPWAVAFGVSEAWIDRFQELTDEGRYRPKFIWYEGLSDSPRRGQGELEALTYLVDDFAHALALATRYASTQSPEVTAW